MGMSQGCPLDGNNTERLHITLFELMEGLEMTLTWATVNIPDSRSLFRMDMGP